MVVHFGGTMGVAMRNVLLFKITVLAFLLSLLDLAARNTRKERLRNYLDRTFEHLKEKSSDLIRDGYRRGLLTSWAHRPY